MSGDVSSRKRLIQITRGNGCDYAFSLEGHEDFFPRESFGTDEKPGKAFLLRIQGCSEVKTDIVSGKASYFLRNREWMEVFCRKFSIVKGHTVAVERIGELVYRVYPFDTPEVDGKYCIKPLKDIQSGIFTVIDLFAGCGGTSLGFERAGFKVIWATDWEPNSCKTFAVNFETPIDCVPIQEISLFPKADVVIGGPPCQGFSNLGEKVPLDPRRQLWRHFLRAVEQSQACAYVMENVAPLLSSAEFEEIKKVSEEMGFCVEGRVLNTANYGVPQTRKRTIIIAIKGMKPVFPEPTHYDPEKLDKNKFPLFADVDYEIKPWLTVRDAIGDLPGKPTEKDWHLGRKPTPKSLKRYMAIPPGGNRFDLPVDLQPKCWIKKTKGGTDLMGRLWWDRPSVTIRTEFFKPEKGRYLHPVENRPITHREAMRLQGFPDTFAFIGAKIAVARQVGNAVPPPLAYAVAKAVGESLERMKEGSRIVKHTNPVIIGGTGSRGCP